MWKLHLFETLRQLLVSLWRFVFTRDTFLDAFLRSLEKENRRSPPFLLWRWCPRFALMLNLLTVCITVLVSLYPGSSINDFLFPTVKAIFYE